MLEVIPDNFFQYSVYLIAFVLCYIILKYTPLNFSTQTAFIISICILLLQILTSQISSSLDKYILIRNEEQCKQVCDTGLKKEGFENVENKNITMQNIQKNYENTPTKTEQQNISQTLTKATDYVPVGDKSMKDVPIDNDYVQHQLSKKLEDDDNEYTDGNTLYVPKDYKYTPDEYGYSYIPPTEWYKKPIRPPVCVIDKNYQHIVSPSYIDNNSVDIKDFQSALRISGPQDINTRYINENMNLKK